MSTVCVARLLLALAFGVPFTGAAEGHAVVVRTVPTDGAMLQEPPASIRIVFNEPVSLVAAQLLDSGGRRLLPPDAATAEEGAVDLALPPSLSRGTYVASYRVVSLDGHPVGGSLVFSIGEASPLAASAPSSDRAWHAIWTAVRATFNAGVLGSAGGVLFLLAVAGSGAVAASTARIAVRLALIGAVAAGLSIGVQGGLLTGGPLKGILGPRTWETGFASTFGNSAIIAVAGSALIVAGLRWRSAVGRATALAGGLLALSSYAFAGHVVTAGPLWLSVPALLAHTSAVAFWVGSLLPLRAALSHVDAAAVVRRFSSVALLAVALLVVAGIVLAALQVRELSALVATTYGRVLLAKLALVASLLSLASFNKFRLTPALARGKTGADAFLRRTIETELAVAAAILVATAALGTTPPPRALQSGHGHTPEHHAAGEHYAHGLSIELSSGDRRATVTFASAHAGPNEVQIAITDQGGAAVQAKEVTFSAANPAAGVEPIRRSAASVRPGVWELGGLPLVPAGRWSVTVDALISDFEKAMFDGVVDIQ